MTTSNYEIKDLFNSNYLATSCHVWMQAVADETNRILNLACNEEVRSEFKAMLKAKQVAMENLNAKHLGKTLPPQAFHIGSQIF